MSIEAIRADALNARQLKRSNDLRLLIGNNPWLQESHRDHADDVRLWGGKRWEVARNIAKAAFTDDATRYYLLRARSDELRQRLPGVDSRGFTTVGLGRAVRGQEFMDGYGQRRVGTAVDYFLDQQVEEHEVLQTAIASRMVKEAVTFVRDTEQQVGTANFFARNYHYPTVYYGPRSRITPGQDHQPTGFLEVMDERYYLPGNQMAPAMWLSAQRVDMARPHA